jgi:hypothetical protein
MVKRDDKNWNDAPQGGAAPRFDRSKDYTPYTPPKDISKKVDEAWKIDDGFSGELPNND